jgi:hypothetical protein
MSSSKQTVKPPSARAHNELLSTSPYRRAGTTLPTGPCEKTEAESVTDCEYR